MPSSSKGEVSSVPSGWLRYGSLGFLVAQDTALVLLLRQSRAKPGAPYIASCAVATMECCKLLACFGVVLWSCELDLSKFVRRLRREVLRPREVLKLSVPALLYLVQNNLLYFALSNLRATPYKVVYNLKILTGALFSWLLLKQDLGGRKWFALVALFAGVVVVQTAPHEKKVTQENGDVFGAPTMAQTLGFVAVLAAAVTSGFCGVYQQKILQGSGDSMWARNIQMGVPSVVIGLMSVFLRDGAQVLRDGPFKNFDRLTCGVIFLQALGGLNVAFILKYADNILKGFAAAFSTVASCLLEMALFGFRPSPNFLLGAALINVAAYYYNYKPSKKTHKVQEEESEELLLPEKELSSKKNKTAAPQHHNDNNKKQHSLHKNAATSDSSLNGRHHHNTTTSDAMENGHHHHHRVSSPPNSSSSTSSSRPTASASSSAATATYRPSSHGISRVV